MADRSVPLRVTIFFGVWWFGAGGGAKIVGVLHECHVAGGVGIAVVVLFAEGVVLVFVRGFGVTKWIHHNTIADGGGSNSVFAFPEIPFFSEKNRASEWSLSGKTLVALLDVETYASAGLALAIAFDFTEVVDNLSSDSGFFARWVPSGAGSGLLRGGMGASRFRFGIVA